MSSAIEARLGREPRTSGRQLAREIGVSKNTLSDWRLGRRQPRRHNLPALAQALGVGATDLGPGRVPATPTGATEVPDVIGLLDELVRLSPITHALSEVGGAVADLNKALDDAKRLRRDLDRRPRQVGDP